MKLGIPVYDGVDLLDVAGPHEMFGWVDPALGLETVVLSADGGPVTTLDGLRFETQAAFVAVPALDVLWVPGGDPAVLERVLSDPASPYLAYLRQAAAGAPWVCSVREGALLLVGAGLLDGHAATTHWAYLDCLRRFPAVAVDPVPRRFVQSGNRLTGGGISAGLDEALQLIALLYGPAAAEAVQVTTQYFPEPPVSGRLPPLPTCDMHWGARTP